MSALILVVHKRRQILNFGDITTKTYFLTALLYFFLYSKKIIFSYTQDHIKSEKVQVVHCKIRYNGKKFSLWSMYLCVYVNEIHV